MTAIRHTTPELVQDESAAIAAKRPKKTAMDRLLSRPESGVIIAAVLVYLFFAFFAPHFFSDRVTSNILLSSASLGIITVGVALLMIAGQFDLSVGSVYGLTSGLAILCINIGLPAYIALPVVLGAGLVIGAINGILVTKLGIHSLIITLGALMFYRGVLLALTQGFPIRLKEPDPFLRAFDFTWMGIPGPFFWFLVLVVVFGFVLNSTRFGNWLFATGGSPEAARSMGVPAQGVQIAAFALASAMAALAGYVSAARFSSVDALRGEGMELEAVLAAVVGGASLSGGYGSIVGAALGVLIIGMIQQGLILMGVSVYWYRAGIGLLLIVAAVVNHHVRIRNSA